MIIIIATFRKMKEKPNVYQPPETQYEEKQKAWVFSNWDTANNFSDYLKNLTERPHSIQSTLLDTFELMI